MGHIFLSQLRLLLWKNFLLKKRKPVSLIFEILIPLFIIFILVSVRTIQLKFRMGRCEFREKQMASMGPVPFFRDFLCTFNTTCYNKTQINWSQNNTNEFQKILDNINIIYNNLPPNDLNQTSLIQWFYEHSNETSQLRNSIRYITNVTSPIIQALSQMQSNNNTINQEGNDEIRAMICGSHENDMDLIVGRFTRSSRSKRSITNCLLSNPGFYLYSFLGGYVYHFIAPIILGKIYYTPDSPFTRELMKRANTTFLILDKLRLSAVNWRLYFGTWFTESMSSNTQIKNLRTICQSVFINIPLCQIISMNNIKNFVGGISEIFSVIENILNCTELDKFVPVQTSSDIDNLANIPMDSLYAAVVFDNSFQYMTNTNASFMNYQIRMPTHRIDSTINFKVLDTFWTPYPRRNTLTDFKYYSSGFLLLQEAIDQAFIEMISGSKPINTGSSMQIMPYPCFVDDRFIRFLSNMMPFLLIIAWATSVACLIKCIVYEKENRLKEFMKVMGLSNFVHWLGWFISTIIILIFPVTIMTIILRYAKILEFSSPGVIFLILLSFVISFICQSFMISVFFDQANVASVSGVIIYFICYLPFLIFVNLQEAMTVEMYFVAGLLSQVSFSNSINFIASWEQSTEGVQFSNLFESSIIDLNFGVGHCMVMMWIDSIIYLLITWYVEAVFPGQYGIAKPWYFLFTKQYWFSKVAKVPCQTNNVSPVHNQVDELLDTEVVNPHGVENEPTDLKIGISIKNLVKIYSKSKTPAVNNLNLNFFESQITSFLGHNGAGKTTTISILTGIYSPTSGTAFILNEDIRTNMDQIRQKMGLCPQHNILFSSLTVEDHIYFYGMLKGMNKENVKEILPKIIEDVGLTKKINSPSKKLSGGMKRKLSVAMAFIGDSRVVFLDEPTAGVDPFARRGIWDLLIKYRCPERTIILTTHHMDEADYLSDRIAIISQGKLQCCGSSVFLKKVFGNGYYLVLMKNENIVGEYVKNGISKSGEKVLTFIKQYVSDAEMIEETKTQWTIVLPQNNCKQLSSLFEELDRSMLSLDIASYGLSDTSLEEVFLKVVDDPSDSANKDNENKLISVKLETLTDGGDLPKPASILSLRNKSELLDSENSPSPIIQLNTKSNLLTGFSLLRQQILGLLIKRFHYTKRNLKGFIVEVILPILVILLMISLLTISTPLNNQPSMVISPWLMMPKSRIVNLNTFYRKENVSNNLVDSLELGYRSDLGESGVRCMNPSIYKLQNYQCYSENSKNQWSPIPQGTIPLLSPECDCKTTGYQTCSNPISGGPQSSFRIMTSSDKLSNLTGYNISDYLMKNFKKFIKKQYGGYQFVLPSEFGQSSKLIGRSPLWIGLRGTINSSISNISVENALKFVDNFQEFFNLSGIKTHFTRIWVNSKGYVSMPAYANIFSNLLLRSRLNSTQNSLNYGISVSNYPLKYTQSDLFSQINKQMFLEISLAIFVIFGLSFIPASFVIFLIEERISGSKRQQFVSGVNPYTYWISNFLWDIVKYIIPVMIVVSIFVAFNYQSYIGKKNAAAFIILLIFYGIAIIPHMYPFSFIIATPSTAFVILNAYNLLVGSITTIATFILDTLEDDDPTLKPVNYILKKVFLIFPQYDLGRGMMDLSFNYLRYNVSEGERPYDPFDWNTTGEKLCSLSVLFVGWWIVIFIIESGIFNRTLCGKFKNFKLKKKEIRYEEDNDVALERERINNTEDKEDVLKVINLTKIYNPSLNLSNQLCKKTIKDTLYSEKRKVAVNNICFGVKGGECFGLLGVNGAGKTTTFKMLTGEEYITRGDAMINGYSIISSMMDAHANMGFCPQFDALHSLLSCEEQLYFYCRIRGIASSQMKSTVESSLKSLSLTPHASKPTHTLSGGNKRKLSTAIALIGCPKVIFLDEPTSGMDAGARRFLWNIIQKLTTENQIAVILTSHNMEECEVLCDRLAIMVNGELKCLGSVQHLKSKFGDDYYVKIRMHPGRKDREAIKNIMQKEFTSGVSLKDENFVTLQFQFDSSSKLSSIFEFFENLKNTDLIVDYSVCQTSLDDVFISFAKDENFINKRNQDMVINHGETILDPGYVNKCYDEDSL